MGKSFSYSPQKLNFSQDRKSSNRVITFCSYVEVSYQKTPNCFVSLFFFFQIPFQGRDNCRFSEHLCWKTLPHQIWPFPQEVTSLNKLPSHSPGFSRALFSGAGCSKGRCFGLPEPEGTLSARSYFNQGIILQPKGSKSPQSSAVTPCMPLKPGRALSFWQCPNHDQNKAVQAAQ